MALLDWILSQVLPDCRHSPDPFLSPISDVSLREPRRPPIRTQGRGPPVAGVTIAYAVQALARHMSSIKSNPLDCCFASLQVSEGDAGSRHCIQRFSWWNSDIIRIQRADWAGDRDTSRSTTAYVFMVGGGAVSWASKLQATVVFIQVKLNTWQLVLLLKRLSFNVSS